jgi:hypothetical protein
MLAEVAAAAALQTHDEYAFNHRRHTPVDRARLRHRAQ